ncbi:MAG: transcriptional regulator [Actinocatenispora sp.]
MSARADREAEQSELGGFNMTIHAPIRLRLCASLEAVGEVEFSRMRELLGISKSALSKHVATLTEEGYVEQRRGVRDSRQRVWLCLTPDGHTAYRDHVAALRAILEQQ